MPETEELSLFTIAKSVSSTNDSETQKVKVKSIAKFSVKGKDNIEYPKLAIETENHGTLFPFANACKNIPDYIDVDTGIDATITLRPDTYNDKDGNTVESFRIVNVSFKPATKVYTELA
jgi:hypothetical protein